MTLVAAHPAAEVQAATPEESTLRSSTAITRYIALGLLLAGTAVLYLWNLSVSGWANAFYSAAAQAGAENWTAMLFGSSDAGNAITVDKTPAALWITDLSVRLFGLSSWSILAPQALMGVGSVAMLYAAVRRAAGPSAALLAGTVLALTPVAALIFRFNNPDALLVLLLIVAAYCVQRGIEKDASRWWFAGAGVALGFGFLAKMLQAFLVLPGLAAAALVAGDRPLGRRVLDLAAAAITMVLSGGWYLALVELWPAASRPYIGGSQHDSIVELALGYNGLGRLTGEETGGLGNLNFDVGPGRLFGSQMGADIGWLLPAALICLVAGLYLSRRAARTDPTRAALILWGGWLLATAVVFSFMNGIVHPYYTVALAPAIGAVIGIGTTALWRHRCDIRAATAMSGTVLVTAILAAVLLSRNDDAFPWLRATVPVAGVGAAVLLLVIARLERPVARATAVLAVAACLAAPAAYSIATAAGPHTGAIPSVGPSRAGGGGFGGMFAAPDPGPTLTATLAADADRFRWAAAVVGSSNAAGYQLATRAPVMAVGGFNGTDPAPTLDEFQRLVADGAIHYFIRSRIMAGGFGGHTPSGSRSATEISDWVQDRYRPVTVDDVTIYDLTQRASNT
ncbi:putative integral membrane protein [Mycolicibacterium fortuitum]|uniref:Putative integral membrane protein n=1 Tax=Mycolicibacterium fortuitum TaxID=1766 RepID=A0A0N9YEC3_MYCFO|nr:putative integral membrane protein [Mycolicibacterium fortuitum]MCA4752465.1 glycosyltransferase family 39 protein [Mycolicibacterium fortuitum]NOR04482.1 phospholipid carrier-dependent glycosyltransferase [Mycolicibacterium fortuitum]OBB00258.1 glycosyl transferase [Mycolicibacterium fortuitum]OBB38046.1 glycosyl transferase [Mycolicibacterium fortuitum]